MSATKIQSAAKRLEEGFYVSELEARNHRWSLHTFLPLAYEPKYPYPLVVFFHPSGSDEEQVLRLAPRLSRRNYVCLSLRGPHETGLRDNGKPGYDWGCSDYLESPLEENVLASIQHVRRTCHVHSERVYLAGIGEGANVAYRLGIEHPEMFAGVIAMNGRLPRFGAPVMPWHKMRELSTLILHGHNNRRVSVETAKKDYRLLFTAGLPVRFQQYPTNHRVHPAMLRDLNRWIMSHLNGI